MESNYKYFIRNSYGFLEEIDFFKSLKYPYHQVFRIKSNNSSYLKNVEKNNFQHLLSKLTKLNIQKPN